MISIILKYKANISFKNFCYQKLKISLFIFITIIFFNLSDFYIKGTIPAHISTLTNLGYLYLVNNDFFGILFLFINILL